MLKLLHRLRSACRVIQRNAATCVTPYHSKTSRKRTVSTYPCSNAIRDYLPVMRDDRHGLKRFHARSGKV